MRVDGRSRMTEDSEFVYIVALAVSLLCRAALFVVLRSFVPSWRAADGGRLGKEEV